MSDDVYTRLREFLDRMPGGFPETESGVEIKILKKLFTPEEAEMATYLSRLPEPVPRIAKQCGMAETEAADMLQSMARRGLIYQVRIGDSLLYRSLQFMVGIYEFHLNTMDQELAELVEEYLPHLDTLTRQFRVLPVGATLDTTPTVATYDQVQDLIKEQSIIAVAPCICRKKQRMLGYECDRPFETCLTFGSIASYYIENDMGRKISAEQALDILDLAEESALVLLPTNAQKIRSICCCCECCCDVLRNMKLLDRPGSQVQSSFQVRIDPDLCSSCGICLDRCQMGAVRESDGATEVDLNTCIGCGLCVSACPEEAMSLVEKAEVPTPAKNMTAMLAKILAERDIS